MGVEGEGNPSARPGCREARWLAQLTAEEAALQRRLDARARRRAADYASHDPEVSPLARLIEQRIPGELLYVNREVVAPTAVWPPPTGGYITDFDVETRRVVIQVKGGHGDASVQKLREQIIKSRRISDKAVIGYAPHFNSDQLRVLRRTGCVVYGNAAELLGFISRQPYPPACDRQLAA